MRRPIVWGGACLMVGVPILAACGGVDESGAERSTPPPSATAYVVVEPPTTPPVTEAPSTIQPSNGGGDAAIADSGEYVVQANDSVFEIADRFGLPPEQLAEINGWSDGVQHTILPGQTIRVAVPTTGAPASGSVPGTDCPSTYTIQAGDTTRIEVAERFGITFGEMDDANVSTPGYSSFVVGTQITIPCPSA